MSIAGPLIAVGLALVFSGLYRAATGAQLLATRQDWALAGLGAAMVIAGVALAAKGL